MDIAAIIISVISLMLSIFCVIIMVSKEWFSSHQVQLVPIDQALDSKGGQGRPMTESYREIGEPLTEDEMQFFDLTNKKKKIHL